VTQPPDDLTQPIPADATHEQQAVDVPAVDAAAPGADAGAPVGVPAVDTATPAWANAAREGDAAASARPVPAAGYGAVPPAAGVAPVAPVAPVVPAAAAAEKGSWRPRVSGGRGLAVGALVVGLGLGAAGGSVATWAVVHDNRAGTVADGTGGFDRDGDGDFGPRGGRGGPPPGGPLPDGGQQQNGDGGTTGQLPGGGAGTDGSTGGTGSDANGTSQGT
jgi:hypothetical protein